MSFPPLLLLLIDHRFSLAKKEVTVQTGIDLELGFARDEAPLDVLGSIRLIIKKRRHRIT